LRKTELDIIVIARNEAILNILTFFMGLFVSQIYPGLSGPYELLFFIALYTPSFRRYYEVAAGIYYVLLDPALRDMCRSWMRSRLRVYKRSLWGFSCPKPYDQSFCLDTKKLDKKIKSH
jgi:hypothetical protein